MASEVLTVTLHRAENLKSADANGLADPYCTFSWEGTDPSQSLSSQVVSKNLNPVWDSTLTLPWNPRKSLGVNAASEVLVVDCFDKDFGGQDFLGRVTIPAYELKDGVSTAYPLKPRNSKDVGITGNVYLTFKLPESVKATGLAPVPPTVASQMDAIDQGLEQYPFIGALAEKLGISRTKLFIGAVIFFAMLILFGWGAKTLSCIVGVMYPMYCSFKAVKSDGTDDDSQWLTYWVVYGFVSVFESFTDFLLFWIPFYYLFKMVFLVYLMHPQLQGAKTLFDRFVHPFLTKYEQDIDQGISSITSKNKKP